MESAGLVRLSIIFHAKVLELFFCRNTRITEQPKHTQQRRCILNSNFFFCTSIPYFCAKVALFPLTLTWRIDSNNNHARLPLFQAIHSFLVSQSKYFWYSAGERLIQFHHNAVHRFVNHLDKTGKLRKKEIGIIQEAG